MSDAEGPRPKKRTQKKQFLEVKDMSRPTLVTEPVLVLKYPSFKHALSHHIIGAQTQSTFYLPLSNDIFDQDVTVLRYNRLLLAAIPLSRAIYMCSGPEAVMIIKTIRPYDPKNVSFVRDLYLQAQLEVPHEAAIKACKAQHHQGNGHRSPFYKHTPLREQQEEPRTHVAEDFTSIYLMQTQDDQFLIEQFDSLCSQRLPLCAQQLQSLRAKTDSQLFTFFRDQLVCSFTAILTNNNMENAYDDQRSYVSKGQTCKDLLVLIASNMDIKSMIMASVKKMANQVLLLFLRARIISVRLYAEILDQLSDESYIRLILAELEVPTKAVYANVSGALKKLSNARISYNTNLIQNIYHNRDAFLHKKFKFLDMDELSRTAVINLCIVSRTLYRFIQGTMIGNNGQTFLLFGKPGIGKTAVYESLQQVLHCYSVNIKSSKGWFNPSINVADVLGFDELEREDFCNPVNKQLLAFDTVIEAAIKHTDHTFIGANTLRFGTSNADPDELCRCNEFFRNMKPGALSVFQAILRRLFPINLILTAENHCHLRAGVHHNSTQEIAASTLGTILLLGYILSGKQVQQPYHPPCFSSFVSDPHVYEKMFETLSEKLLQHPGSFILKRMLLLFDKNPVLLQQVQASIDSFQGIVYNSQKENIAYYSSESPDYSRRSPQTVTSVREGLIRNLNKLIFGSHFHLMPDMESLEEDNFGTDQCLIKITAMSQKMAAIGQLTTLKTMVLNAHSDLMVQEFVVTQLTPYNFSSKDIRFYVGYLLRYSDFQRKANQLDQQITFLQEVQPNHVVFTPEQQIFPSDDLSQEVSASFGVNDQEEAKFMGNGIEVFPHANDLSSSSLPQFEHSLFAGGVVLSPEVSYINVGNAIKQYEEENYECFEKIQTESAKKRMRKQ